MIEVFNWKQPTQPIEDVLQELEAANKQLAISYKFEQSVTPLVLAAQQWAELEDYKHLQLGLGGLWTETDQAKLKGLENKLKAQAVSFRFAK